MITMRAEVRTLPPMSVVAAQVVGTQPETEAWNKLTAWAEPAGLLKDPDAHPIYGFNNPPPEANGSTYGYELWIRVDPGTAAAAGLERKEFPGGRYLVTRCRLKDDPRGTMPEVWQQLVKWAEEQGYRWRHTHELEHVLNPGAPEQDLMLDLYFPIEED